MPCLLIYRENILIILLEGYYCNALLIQEVDLYMIVVLLNSTVNGYHNVNIDTTVIATYSSLQSQFLTLEAF